MRGTGEWNRCCRSRDRMSDFDDIADCVDVRVRRPQAWRNRNTSGITDCKACVSCDTGEWFDANGHDDEIRIDVGTAGKDDCLTAASACREALSALFQENGDAVLLQFLLSVKRDVWIYEGDGLGSSLDDRDTEPPLAQGFSHYTADVATTEDDGRTRSILHECCDSVHMRDRPHREDVRCIDPWNLWQYGFCTH